MATLLVDCGVVMVGIPYDQLRLAVEIADLSPTREVGGFFFSDRCTIDEYGEEIPDAYSDGRVIERIKFYQAPDSGAISGPGGVPAFEISAEWMADRILGDGLDPVACFHSHPSGLGDPSHGDVRGFPVQYCKVGFIYPIGWKTSADRRLFGVGACAGSATRPAGAYVELTSYNELGTLHRFQLYVEESGEVLLDG